MCASFFKTRIHQLCKLPTFPSQFVRKLHKHLSAERLSNRKVIRISGENSFEFLQGLITNDMNNLMNGSNSLYTLFLNSKGRVLYDAIIFQTNENNTFLLDCDSECTQQLVKHLKLYKLRKKVDIAPIDSEYSVWAIYDTSLIDKLQNIQSSGEIKIDLNLDVESVSNEKDIVVADPRLSALGYRAIVQSGEKINKIPANDKYKMCRYKLGIGEGVSELKVGQCFPLEINCDYMNGVSFDKGCYIGQELTARTHHTGVVRKRIMPLVFDSQPKDIPHDTSIDDPTVSRKTPIGKIKGYVENFGIGLMRVSETLETKSLKMLDFDVRAIIPYWWPNDSVQFKKNVKTNK